MEEETFTIFVDASYERGIRKIFEGTLVECMEWLRKGAENYHLGFLEIYSNSAPSIEDLAKPC